MILRNPIGGHLTRLGTRNKVAVQKEFINNLKNISPKANQEVLFSKVAQQVGHFDNPWLIFSKYIDAVNEKCTQLVLPKWENKLGGARNSCRPIASPCQKQNSKKWHIAGTNPE